MLHSTVSYSTHYFNKTGFNDFQIQRLCKRNSMTFEDQGSLEGFSSLESEKTMTFTRWHNHKHCYMTQCWGC